MKRYLIGLTCVVLSGCVLRVEILPNVRLAPESKPTSGPTNYADQWRLIR